jgi:hypothetical protein
VAAPGGFSYGFFHNFQVSIQSVSWTLQDNWWALLHAWRTVAAPISSPVLGKAISLHGRLFVHLEAVQV